MASSTMQLYKVGSVGGDQFVKIPNELARSQVLTGTAFKLLACLLSHDNSFRQSVAVIPLCEYFKEGKSAIRSAIDLLEKHGYMVTKHVVFPGEITARWVRFVTHDPELLSGDITFQPDMIIRLGSNKVTIKEPTDDTVRKSDHVAKNDTVRKSDHDTVRKSACPSYTEKNKGEKQLSLDAKEASEPPELLLTFVKMWTLLESKGLVYGKHDPQKLAPGVLKSFDKFMNWPSLKHVRLALSDLSAVYNKIANAKGLRENGKPKTWFTLKKLLSETGGSGEHVAISLMDGRYDNEFKYTGTNGRIQGERGAGHGDAVRSPAARVRNRDYSGIVGEKV